jgi:hypothetical protein
MTTVNRIRRVVTSVILVLAVYTWAWAGTYALQVHRYDTWQATCWNPQYKTTYGIPWDFTCPPQRQRAGIA